MRKYNIRFDETLKYSEDKKFRLECIYLSQNISSFSDVLYLYRDSENSAMKKMHSWKPFDYFMPIINGCLDIDDFLNKIPDVPQSTAGTVLASIYIMEMVEYSARISIFEGIKMAKKIKELPFYNVFAEMREKDVSKSQFANKNLLIKSPLRFCIKHYFAWIPFRMAYFVLRFKHIEKKYKERKYPYEKII